MDRLSYIAERVARSAQGDCYEAAGHYFMDHGMFGMGGNMVLVHGEVLGQGPLEGVRFGHAWVEEGGAVVDEANGRHIRMPKQAYYTLGDIKRTVKYSFEEFRGRISKYKHWGPWDLKTAL